MGKKVLALVRHGGNKDRHGIRPFVDKVVSMEVEDWGRWAALEDPAHELGSNPVDLAKELVPVIRGSKPLVRVHPLMEHKGSSVRCFVGGGQE